ncbi:hypothetical protein D3C78_1764490 [compost metagenome]
MMLCLPMSLTAMRYFPHSLDYRPLASNRMPSCMQPVSLEIALNSGCCALRKSSGSA